MSEIILDDFKASSEANDERYFLAYFGRQREYYMRRYLEFQSGKKFTFNIGPFLAGWFWFLYRKLYLQFAIVFCVLLGVGIIEAVAFELLRVPHRTQLVIDWILNIIWWFAFGFGGNYLYLRQAERNIHRILASTQDEESRLRLLSKKGGISYSPYYVLGVVLLLLILIFTYDIFGLFW